MKLSALLLCVLLLGLLAVPGAVAGAGTMEISGHVKDAQGAPLSDVAIFVHDLDSNMTLDPVITATDGSFYGSIPSGRYSISAVLPTYRANTSYTVTASADNLNFTLYGLGQVTGYVTDGNHTLPGVKVTIKNSTEEFITYTTSPWGQFTIENVTVGEYIATAEMLGYVNSTYLDPVIVTRGGTVSLDFTMVEVADKTARISGQITFDGVPVEGAKVTLEVLDGADLVTYTDAHGNYLIKGIPPGQYQLTISKNGYIGSSQKVALSLLEQKDVDVVLNKDSLPGNSGFILNYDLAHSLTVIALGLSIFTTIVALVLRRRAKSKPEMLEKIEDN